MNVHFIASNRGVAESIKDFRCIVNVVHKHGHELTRDWVEPAYQRAQAKQGFEDLDWKIIFKENMEALMRADVVIVETTVNSFAVGFQTAVGLQLKKPTILLSRNVDVERTFMSGLQDDLLVCKKYRSEADLGSVVADFLRDNTIEVKDMRFNFFIDRQIYNYLRWASHKTGDTKAEILRNLVLREIERDKPSV